MNQNEKELYGICGLKGHGKDTFSNLIISQNNDFELFHFADMLKDMCQKIFGLSKIQMFDAIKKEEKFENFIVMDDYLPSMKKMTGLDLEPANCIATCVREVMQFFGTEYVRKKNPNFWAEDLFSKIKDKKKILISDLRFPNEASFILKNNGTIIKIVRIDIDTEGDEHSSETSLKEIEYDLVVGVMTNDLSLPTKIANLISCNNFIEAQNYDYRKLNHNSSNEILNYYNL